MIRFTIFITLVGLLHACCCPGIRMTNRSKETVTWTVSNPDTIQMTNVKWEIGQGEAKRLQMWMWDTLTTMEIKYGTQTVKLDGYQGYCAWYHNRHTLRRYDRILVFRRGGTTKTLDKVLEAAKNCDREKIRNKIKKHTY